MAKKICLLCFGGLLLILSGTTLVAAADKAEKSSPTPVSPGDARAPVAISQSCPTFLWGHLERAIAFELVVYRTDVQLDDGKTGGLRPILGARLPGSAPGWTPPQRSCLERGGRYAWLLRAQEPSGKWGAWSEPRLFQVSAAPVATEVAAALEVLRQYIRSEGEPPAEPAGAGARTLLDEESKPGRTEPGDRRREEGIDEKPTPLLGPVLVATPDLTAIRGVSEETAAIAFGVHGSSAGTDAGSAGVVGESTATSGGTFGVVGQVRSAAGVAGAFANIAGGDILRGSVGGVEVFTLDGSGMVAATAFKGDGAALTGVDADTLDGLDSTQFLTVGGDEWVDEVGDTMTGTLTLSPGSGPALVTTAGNVGIGTATPFQPLDVTGNINLDGELYKGRVLFLHTTGSSNTGIGRGALSPATSGYSNTAVGGAALFSNSTGSRNTAAGYAALAFNTHGRRNTASGHHALYANTTGSDNTAVGRAALRANTTVSFNTAIGSYALTSSTGGGNTAIGADALYANTTGFFNTATGHDALRSNTTGYRNTATGIFALQDNTTGLRNTAHGNAALALNTSGHDNTALGSQALLYNTSGGRNTALGLRAGINSSSGDDNIFIGTGAGHNITSGSDNILIGSGGFADESATIRIGDGRQDRTFITGIRGVTTWLPGAIPVLIDAVGQLGTISSSRRFKEDIQDMNETSSRLLELRPVTFRYKSGPTLSEAYEQPILYGLIAEEVAEVLPELVAYSDDGQPETVLYHLLGPMLLNELQKQQRQIEKQRRLLEVQEARLQTLEWGRTGFLWPRGHP